MKKFLSLLAVLCLALTATACTHYSNQQYYEQAQLYLGCGNYAHAAELFSQLGEYRESAEYALYASALKALEEGDLPLARTNLGLVSPFRSSEMYLQVIDALEAETAGDLPGALRIYEALGTFHNSHEAAEKLRDAIPADVLRRGRALMAKGEYEAARDLLETLEGNAEAATLASNCTAALERAAYARANALCTSGDHAAAMAAFLALGDALDAPERAAQCRAALLLSLRQRAESVTLETAANLIADCTALDDPEAAAQAAALTSRFGVNLQLLENASTQPWVLLGQYPVGESGVKSDLLWRVVSVDGANVTLLCETVIDASPIATGTDLQLTQEEADALALSTLPSAADLASLGDLTCPATPYAVAQGVSQAEGLALYWLRDSLENGIHPVVSSTGALMLPTQDDTPGIRPLVTISLEQIAFTAGDGTRDNPFR